VVIPAAAPSVAAVQVNDAHRILVISRRAAKAGMGSRRRSSPWRAQVLAEIEALGLDLPDRVPTRITVLARLIDARPAFDPRAWMAELPPMDLYGALLFQVTGQQLSVPATRRTLARIEALFGGHLPHRPNCWAWIPRNSARPACPGERSARSATSPSE
jgi:3-methyladenine DNA glycosylase/8-oxoguanine DNA glycosylase